jgi:bidirectional [NiFe] hydrogenase diaphorase subunit
MAINSASIAPPSDDKRWRLVTATMRRHGYEPNALIETLHTVQESFGYLEEDTLRFVAHNLHVPLSKVYGVATFYHFFSLKPEGKHRCVMCLGTACYIKGSAAILDSVQRAYQVEPGRTTEDGELSLLTARCLGSCSLAPAAVFDDEVVGKLTANSALEHIQRLTTS